MKLKVLAFLVLFSVMPVYSADFTELVSPKSPLYRVGLTDEPEVKYSAVDDEIQANLMVNEQNIEYSIGKIAADNVETCDLSKITYADLSIKRLSKEISKEVALDEKQMLADLSLLWHGAATQSDTINFALYKLFTTGRK